jgi:hypothetical protein
MRQLLFRVFLLVIAIRTVALVVIEEVIARSWFASTIRTIIWVVALVVSILCDLIIAFRALTFIIVKMTTGLGRIKIHTSADRSTLV